MSVLSGDTFLEFGKFPEACHDQGRGLTVPDRAINPGHLGYHGRPNSEATIPDQSCIFDFLKHYRKLVPTLDTFPASSEHASAGDTDVSPVGSGEKYATANIRRVTP